MLYHRNRCQRHSTRRCEHARSHPRYTGALILGGQFESSGALPSGHASSQTTPRRSHTTLLTPSQCPNPWVVPPRDNIAHFVLAGPTQTCATSRVTYRSSATAWAHAHATMSVLARAGQPRQEPRKAGPQRRPLKRQQSLGSRGGKRAARAAHSRCAAGRISSDASGAPRRPREPRHPRGIWSYMLMP